MKKSELKRLAQRLDVEVSHLNSNAFYLNQKIQTMTGQVKVIEEVIQLQQAISERCAKLREIEQTLKAAVQ